MSSSSSPKTPKGKQNRIPKGSPSTALDTRIRHRVIYPSNNYTNMSFSHHGNLDEHSIPGTVEELSSSKGGRKRTRRKSRKSRKRSRSRKSRKRSRRKRSRKSKRRKSRKRTRRKTRKRSRKSRKSRKRTRRRTKRKRSRSRKSHYKLPPVPRGTKFQKGPGRYKYTAIMPSGKRVNFGHRDYQHYRDRVPKNKGGKLWSHLNHNDRDRMQNYRSRHRGVNTKSGTPAYKKKYSPSWFSYHYLW